MILNFRQLVLSFATFATSSLPQAAERPNVLFIAIDDLRPELGCYGAPLVQSPNLDKLAKEGLRFDRAYCQQAICHPSRTSLMSGQRPDKTKVVHNYIAMREANPDILTMPQHLMAHGYETVFHGKIFHGKWTDEERSWSRKPAWKKFNLPKPKAYANPENQKLRNENFKAMYAKYGEAAKQGLGNGPAFESADVPDHTYRDGFNTALASKTLEELAANKDKPFFLAMGYVLPHLNWNAPKKYWDLYDRGKIKLATQKLAPKDGAAMGLHASFELRVRHGIPKYGPIDDELATTLLHAYYASTSYVDAQIGKLIAALEKAGVRENTVIVVWGDHGWHLGEMGIWGKATNYELGTRVPLIAWTPHMKTRGKGTRAIVELIDLFPTLCDLCRVPVPGGLDGTSLVPLLDDPGQPWKKAAVSQFPNPALREWAANPLSVGMRETFFGPLIKDVEERIIRQQGKAWDRDLFENHLMGYALRTDRFRLVSWRDHRDLEKEPVFVELYDHQVDPTETTNVASANPEVVARLSKQLNTLIRK